MATLSPTWPCAALPDAPLAERTTMRVGGRAEWLLEPATPEELAAGLAAARERGLPVRLLGGGANLIVEDGRLPGVVVATARLQRLFRVDPHGGAALEAGRVAGLEERSAAIAREADLRLVAWAGVSLPRIVATAARLGWRGVEGLVGVPGNVGGGLAMNAGGRWGDLWDVVERVLVVDAQCRLVERTRAEVGPRYRDGGLGASAAAGCVMRFELDRPEDVRERGRAYLREKNRVQPVTEASSGCIFVNPPPELSGGRSAGQLVEACGLKGHARGDAIVSPKHANFIVNRGRARAADVLALIDEVHDRVRERTGVDLRVEVRVWRAGG